MAGWLCLAGTTSRSACRSAQAGYPDGIDITLEYAAVFWFEEQVAIQMKDQLAKAGIRVKLQKISDADMRSRTASNKRDLGFFTFQDKPIILDPVYALYLNAHSQGASNRNNYTNPEFDKLIDAARIEQNPKKRLDLVRKAQQIHTADATWVMTMYPGSHEAMPPLHRDIVTPEMLHDLPAGGKRLVQRVDGYKATIVSGVPIFEQGIDTGARPGKLVRAGRL